MIRADPWYNNYMNKIYDTAIVGGGIAGFSAALTAKSLKLDYVWFGEKAFGKKTASAEYVRNYPSFTGGGAEFSAALEKQKAAEEIVLTERRIDGVYKAAEGFFLTSGEENYTARTVILATGVELGAGVKGEREFLGKGVSYCAVCDGALYRGKRIAALLSSDDAEEAEYLASFAEEVLLFSAKPVQVKAKNIRTVAERVVAVEGEKRVERVVTGAGAYPVSGVFFLGKALPPDVLFAGLKTEGASVVVGRGGETSVKGVFAAGDVTGKPYQFAKAAGEGCVAAYSVKDYLKSGKKDE